MGVNEEDLFCNMIHFLLLQLKATEQPADASVRHFFSKKFGQSFLGEDNHQGCQKWEHPCQRRDPRQLQEEVETDQPPEEGRHNK